MSVTQEIRDRITYDQHRLRAWEALEQHGLADKAPDAAFIRITYKEADSSVKKFVAWPSGDYWSCNANGWAGWRWHQVINFLSNNQRTPVSMTWWSDGGRTAVGFTEV